MTQPILGISLKSRDTCVTPNGNVRLWSKHRKSRYITGICLKTMFFRHNFLTVGSFPRILFDSESCGPELSANIYHLVCLTFFLFSHFWAIYIGSTGLPTLFLFYVSLTGQARSCVLQLTETPIVHWLLYEQSRLVVSCTLDSSQMAEWTAGCTSSVGMYRSKLLLVLARRSKSKTATTRNLRHWLNH